MKSNLFKKISTFACISMLAFSLMGCDFLDELLEPQQKEYAGTIYNQTDKKDKNFNEYDGVVDENEETPETTETPSEGENIITQEPTETPQQGAYQFNYDDVKEYAISETGDNGYTITFTLPKELIDFTNISQIKKPKNQIIDLKKNSWQGSFYRYLGTDNQKVKVITAIYPLESFETLDNLATMSEGTYNKFQTSNSTVTIQEGNIVELVVNGYTNVSYRVYPYDTETGKSAIIMSAAQIGDKYMYAEFWIEDVFESVNYEDLIVHLFSSAICTESENVVFE